MGIMEISFIVAVFIFLVFLIWDLYFTHKKLKEKTNAEITYRIELIRTLALIREYLDVKIMESDKYVENDD